MNTFESDGKMGAYGIAAEVKSRNVLEKFAAALAVAPDAQCRTRI